MPLTMDAVDDEQLTGQIEEPIDRFQLLLGPTMVVQGPTRPLRRGQPPFLRSSRVFLLLEFSRANENTIVCAVK